MAVVQPTSGVLASDPEMVAMRIPGALLVLMLLGCSAPTEEATSEPEQEVTTFADPTPEATTPADAAVDTGGSGGSGGSGGVAVELPGLPIGGGGAVFSEPGVPQCLGVNLTGDPLPAGVGVVIEEFDVPAPFDLSDDLCGDAPACLGGHVLRPAGGTSCEVAVQWTGEEGTSGSLGVKEAVGSCEEPAQCALAAEIVATAAPQSLPLTLEPAVPEPGPTDSGTGTDADTAGPTEPSP
jgi:hypothetical protein